MALKKGKAGLPSQPFVPADCDTQKGNFRLTRDYERPILARPAFFSALLLARIRSVR